MQKVERKVVIAYNWHRNDKRDIKDTHLAELDQRADERIRAQWLEGFTSGELNADICVDKEDGEGILYSGWWELNYIDVAKEKAQQRIEKAGHYLSDSESTIEEMLALIDAYDGDENNLLSSIEGVCVWAQVEESLSIEQFRSCIED